MILTFRLHAEMFRFDVLGVVPERYLLRWSSSFVCLYVSCDNLVVLLT